MDRARMLAPPIPRGAIDVRLVRRGFEWVRCYKIKNGDKIRTLTKFYVFELIA